MERREYFEAADAAYDNPAPEIERRLRELTDRAAAEYGADSSLCASMHSELGGFYRGQGRYTDSETEFRTALRILETALGKDSPDYATGINNLAGTHRLMGNYDEAEREFQEALILYGRSVGEHHVLYASALNNLSLLCLDRGDLRRAAECLQRSSAILSEMPERRDEYASSICNLAVLDQRLGRPEDAIRRLTEAVALYEGPLGTDTPHYHAALTSLGICYYSLGRLPEARDAMVHAAGAAKELYGEKHHEYRRILDYLKAINERMGEQG